MDNRTEELEIDLLDLFLYLKKKIVMICAVVIACAACGFLFTKLCIPYTYTASTRIYVLNRQSETSVVSSDYTISNYMINDYTVLITGQNVTKEVVAQLDLGMTHQELSNKIEVTSPDNTRILQINVTDTDPKRAADIVNCVREVSMEQIMEIMNVDAVNLVYEADVPNKPSGPSVKKNTLLAAIIGFAAVVGVFVVIYLLDDTIRTEEDVEKHLGLATLGVIPASNDFLAAQGGNLKKSVSKASLGRKK